MWWKSAYADNDAAAPHSFEEYIMLKRIILLAALLVPVAATAHADNKIGVKFVNQALSGNQVVEIVAPAANTNGLFIRTATVINYGGGATALFADTTAPTPGAGWKRPVYVVHGFSTGTAFNAPTSIFIPAGYGLYGMSQGTNGAIHLTWDVVS